MPIDIARQLGALTREVRSREHEGRPVRVVVAGRAYDTTPEDLWDALTSKTRIPRWFLPVEGDLRLGGRFQLQGNAGGEILACEAPHRLHVTWECGDEFSWVEVQLHALDATRTELRLEHIAPLPEAKWEQFGPGAVGVGWDLALFGLAGHITAGAAVDPTEAAAWLASNEGKTYIRDASARWGRAALAGGETPSQAEAAANRTTMAYLGEAPADPPSSAR